MKVTPFKHLVKEDVDQQFRPLIDKIGYNINNFADQLEQAVNGNLSITDNLNLSKIGFTVIVDASGAPTIKTSFKSGLKSICAGLQVIYAVNLTNSKTYPTGTPFISFSENNGIITINNITNLAANNKYDLKIIAYP